MKTRRVIPAEAAVLREAMTLLRDTVSQKLSHRDGTRQINMLVALFSLPYSPLPWDSLAKFQRSSEALDPLICNPLGQRSVWRTVACN